MAVEVTAFTAMARAEFMKGKMAAEQVGPAAYEQFVTRLASTTRVETHTFMSSLPRLREFKGYTPFARLGTSEYVIPNKEYRVGLAVRKTDLDDDQIGGYMNMVNGLPGRAKADVGFRILDHLAAGTSTTADKLAFDGAAFFADSHNIGTGDNLLTKNCASDDAVTHKAIFLINNNFGINPVIFQDREPMSGLKTDAETAGADLLKEYNYWVDTRFGLGYGFWWDAIHVTITDTPSLPELQQLIRDVDAQFRGFKIPKGSGLDTDLYVHEGWMPSAQNTTIVCSTGLYTLFRTVLANELITTTAGSAVTNDFVGWANLVPTPSLN